jgi:hypothetical protein
MAVAGLPHRLERVLLPEDHAETVHGEIHGRVLVGAGPACGRAGRGQVDVYQWHSPERDRDRRRGHSGGNTATKTRHRSNPVRLAGRIGPPGRVFRQRHNRVPDARWHGTDRRACPGYGRSGSGIGAISPKRAWKVRPFLVSKKLPGDTGFRSKWNVVGASELLRSRRNRAFGCGFRGGRPRKIASPCGPAHRCSRQYGRQLPQDHAIDRRDLGLSAWRTGSSGAPCACRTSCVPPRGCRGSGSLPPSARRAATVRKAAAPWRCRA